MIRIVITEDQEAERKKLAAYIRQFAREKSEEIEILEFPDGLDLLEDYPDSPDVLFLDIDMRHLSGIETARRIRVFDEHVKILFVTRMVQYALEGYDVQAVDYIVKPVTYELFCRKLARVINSIVRDAARRVQIKTLDGQLLIDPDELIRAETKGKHIALILKKGNTVPETAMPIYQLERVLDPQSFFRCHNAFLINLKYVTGYTQTEILLNGEKIPLSKHRRKAFTEALMAYHASRM